MSNWVFVDAATFAKLAEAAAAPSKDMAVAVDAARENPECVVTVKHGQVSSIEELDK
jgi:hypothetical protein